MKKFLAIFFSALLICATVIACTASLLSPGLSVLSEDTVMICSGLSGTAIKFTSDSICKWAGVDKYDTITITTLPPEADGTLFYNSAAAAVNQKISYDNTDRLSFIPSDGVKETNFRFTFDRSYSISCTVKVLDEINFAPTANAGKASFETFSGSSFSGQMVASDPEGDELCYEITKAPVLGNIDYDAKTGHFTYSPTSLGPDSFKFIVHDMYGNYSKEASIEFNVTRNSTALAFADMTDNGAYTDAIILSEKGLMTYTENDGEFYFEPDSEVTRLDFLVTAMNVLGASNIPTPTSSGFADDSDIPAEYKGYVYSAYKLGIINGVNEDGKIYFMPNKIITRGEAAVIMNNIIGHTAPAGISFRDEIPAWAKDSVSAMYELGAYALSDGRADVSASLTRANEALLLHRIRCLIY